VKVKVIPEEIVELKMGWRKEEDGTGPGEEDLDWRNFQNAKTEP
jgi:hypothetical protein